VIGSRAPGSSCRNRSNVGWRDLKERAGGTLGLRLLVEMMRQIANADLPREETKKEGRPVRHPETGTQGHPLEMGLMVHLAASELMVWGATIVIRRGEIRRMRDGLSAWVPRRSGGCWCVFR